MKKLFGAAIALIASVAFGATLTPIQLLNPAGSTSGQVILSSGPSSAPSWGGISLSGLGAIAANTVVANATSASAVPSAFSMPSCSSSSSALQWTSNTGFTCYGNSASLTGSTFTGAVLLGYSTPIFTLNDTSGTNYTQINLSASGVTGWDVGANSSGGNFYIGRFTSGTFTDSPLLISRSTGLVTIADGATFTGHVNVTYSGASLFINDSSGTNQYGFGYQSNGTPVWATWAAGGTTGNWVLQRYVSGSPQDNPISVSNTTGLVTFADGITGAIGATTASTGAFTTLSASSSATVNTGAATSILYLNANAGQEKATLAQSAASNRWAWGSDNSSESGSNAGSNWFAARFNDSGVFIDNPIYVTRSSGIVTFADGITANGTNSIAGYAPLASAALTGTPTAPTASTGTSTTQIATTQFVNNEIGGGVAAASFTTLTASAAITPSQSAGIVGTTTSNNANAGSVGEYVSSTSSLTSISTATPTNITSISLSAGDWDVTGTVCINPTASITQLVAGVSTTSATLPSAPNISSVNATSTSGAGFCLPVMTTRETLSATTTIYLVANTQFSSGTAQSIGILRARRPR
jgi:hypothetical protein